eukprot:UN27435
MRKLSSVQLGMQAYRKCVTPEVIERSYILAGMYILPGGSGLVDINSKLRRGALVILKEIKPEEEINLNLEQMLSGLDNLERASQLKKEWKCPNVGCNVIFPDKYKQIVSTWPEESTHSLFLIVTVHFSFGQ